MSKHSRKSPTTTTKTHQLSGKSYAQIWRWHFYAGFFSAPFLMMLAFTGMMMILLAFTDGRDGERMTVMEQETPQPVSVQAQAALAAIPNGIIKQYIAPRSPTMVAVFRVDSGKKAMLVAVNPYTAKALKTYPRRKGLYQLMDDIHGTLLLGKTGDFLIETAASLTILMIATGWYMWWIRQRSIRKSLLPVLGKKNTWWKNTHGATGAWISIILLFFLISGVSWAGIWGGKLVQPWSSFPAAKKAKNNHSHPTYAEVLNDGIKVVPWALELTPMPISDKNSSSELINKTAIENLDTLDQYARDNGFDGRYQLHFPKGEQGVWTFTQNSMSYDSKSPTADHTLHLDQYTGEKLADVHYDEYSPMAKFMAVGIALHIGTLGWWSIAANVLFCLAVIFMCIGGFVMWWKRRPNKAAGLTPPPVKSASVNTGFTLLLLILAALFPTAIIAIIAIAIVDYLVISRIPFLNNFFK